MLPLLLLCSAALTIANPAYKCDLSKVPIAGGNYTVSDDGRTVTYRCPKGMYPDPGPIRECKEKGHWNNEKKKPACKRVECPRPIAFESGEFSPRSRNDKYFVGDVLHFECWGGFQLIGPENRTCQENGKWSGTTSVCDNKEGHCPNPGIPIGASKDGTSYGIEDRVKYGCQDGLLMLGSSIRQCLEDKTWSGTEPSCRNWYTYDSPEEVAQGFASSLAETIESSDPNKVEEKGERRVAIKEGGPMNIFIIIDASKSVEEENFNTAKDIVKIFLEKISTYDFIPKFCVISYASEAKIVMSITDDQSTDIDEVIKRIDEYQYSEHEDKQGTNTRGALQAVYNELSLLKLRQESETFFATSNVLMLLTDGKHNMGGDPSVAIKGIRDFINIRKDNDRENKLDIYAFGVGEEINIEELNDIASKKDGEQHAFKMESIDAMKEAFDKIIDETETFEMCGLYKDHTGDLDEQFPWIAKVTITRVDGAENCKGSVITRNFILTAAHCLHLDDQVHFITVTAGERTGLKVKDIHRHPLYNPTGKKDKNIDKNFEYDLALIELEKKLEFSAKVRPVCLPCTSGTSWALKLRNRAVSCQDHLNILLPKALDRVNALFITEDRQKNFKELVVTIKQGRTRDACLEDVKKVVDFKDVANIKDVVTDNFYCTGGTQPKVEEQTCKGDSGGPLIIRHKKRCIQVGVISWGTIHSCAGFKRDRVPDGSRDFHSVVTSEVKWIGKVVQEELIIID